MQLNIDAGRTAILALDFQGSILDPLQGTAELLACVGHAIAAMREAGGTIGYVRVAFEPIDLDGFPGHSAMGRRMKAAGAKVLADAPTTAIDARIAPLSGDIVVRKTRVGAFWTTDLHDQLRRRGIETIVLAGVHTSGAVLSTLRDAHDRDYRVIVLRDGCADPDPTVHDVLMNMIFPKQATVITTADLLHILDVRKAAAHA
jgi:nicotinamidase-related amidase